MKNVTKIFLTTGCMALIGATAYASIYISTDSSVESLRTQAQEARLREEQARIDREAREEALSEAIYDQCYSQSVALDGTKFEEKQRRAFECWRNQTNGTGKLAPASEPPSRTIISNTPQNVSNKSTLRLDTEGSSRSGGQIQQTQKAQGERVVTSQESRPKILTTQAVSDNRGQVPKGKDSDYWSAYETAIAQIHKWEGLRLSAYWDHVGYSIGYGTRAKSKNEKITRAEADRRLIEKVKPLLAQVQKDFPTLRPEAQGALVSFAYNCPKGYESVRKNGLQYHSQWCKTASGDILSGLVKRRAEESKLIFSK